MGVLELHAAWFSALGEPLCDGEREEVAAYLAGLGLAQRLPLLAVQSWPQAAGIIRSPAGDWWQAEEAERARLEAQARLDPSDAQWLALTETLHGAAAVAAARAGSADPALIRAAAGSAIYAAHQYRLAGAMRAPESHPFVRKHALFAGGRWPLGVYDGRFAIY